MTMQTDVLSSHLTQSGFMSLQAPCRLKNITFSPSGGQSGAIAMFDTKVAPTSATYARSGTTITVTSSAHGLKTGTLIGIGFSVASGNSATDGNFTITVTDANTFTITDINSGTIQGGTACQYVVAYPGGDSRYQYPQRFLLQLNTLTGQTSSQQVSVPGEGMQCRIGLYTYMNNVAYATVFYG